MVHTENFCITHTLSQTLYTSQAAYFLLVPVLRDTGRGQRLTYRQRSVSTRCIFLPVLTYKIGIMVPTLHNPIGLI